MSLDPSDPRVVEVWGAVRAVTGLRLTPVRTHLVEIWLRYHSPAEIIETLRSNSEKVLAASQPIAYFGGILRHRRTEPTQAAISPSTPSPATSDPDSQRSRALRAREEVRWILETVGDPETSAAARAEFNDRATFITQDRPDEDRWAKWQRLCREEGIEP